MKNQTQLTILFVLFVAMTLTLFSINASAGTIRCGGSIIDDGDRRGISKQEVEKRCGPPYSKYGNSWLYSMPNGTVTRIRFKDNGEVTSITNERI
jgi:hypothetical protein